MSNLCKGIWLYVCIFYSISAFLFTLSILTMHEIMISSGIFLISLIEPIVFLKRRDYYIYATLSIISVLFVLISLKYLSLIILVLSLIYVTLKEFKAIVSSSLLIASMIIFMFQSLLIEKILFFVFLLLSTISIGFVTKRVHAFVIVIVALISLFTSPLVGLISSSVVAAIASFYFRQEEKVCPFTTDAGLAVGGGFIAGITIILSALYGWNLIVSSLLVLSVLLLLSGSMKPETVLTNKYENN
ncbi:hypothetical protein Calag_0540 [Caldisphaera lagunensis DSM 15908]|uniref:Uncharacterized protein n=1 Tax=Caldisphaera lagunensis (strain DSM 15908 / JCM 11604 / ANMR 0165 / IC-154) TaxID=1056495 RepID=L0AB73_CALLD|nr:hypothetical protein [Caldisphaera lagunensis]AFZ70300.1 hypothetical protein Calag_0540 [Caldisphaera lagunensis DSM 15908]